MPADAGRLIQISLLGEAIEFLPVAVFVFDDAGRYVAVNGPASEITGYSRDELLSMRLGQLADNPAEAISSYRAIAEGQASEGRTRIRRKDGSAVDISFRGGESKVGGMPFYVGVAWEAA